MQIFPFLKIISLFLSRFFFFLNTFSRGSHKFAARLRIIGQPCQDIHETHKARELSVAATTLISRKLDNDYPYNFNDNGIPYI